MRLFRLIGTAKALRVGRANVFPPGVYCNLYVGADIFSGAFAERQPAYNANLLSGTRWAILQDYRACLSCAHQGTK